MANLGGAGGAAAFALASFRKIQGLPVSKIVRTADSTIIIVTNFYLAASSHEIFLRVGGREGMKGLGALQRHQLPHPPLQKSWIRHWTVTASLVHGECHTMSHIVNSCPQTKLEGGLQLLHSADDVDTERLKM